MDYAKCRASSYCLKYLVWPIDDCALEQPKYLIFHYFMFVDRCEEFRGVPVWAKIRVGVETLLSEASRSINEIQGLTEASERRDMKTKCVI